GLTLKILILEDSKPDFELIQEQLSDSGYILELTHAANQDEYFSALKQHSYDIILSDFNLPGFDAFEALRASNKVCPEVPFICISGSIGEEKAIELLKMGAVDYVLKDRPERLPFAVKRALDEAKEKLAHKRAVKALQESEHRFKQVAENAQEWIWEINKNGLYTYASPVVSSLLGYSADEIVGQKHFYDLFDPEKKEDIMESYLDFFSRKESFRNFENPNVHKNGQIILINTSGSPIMDENGEILGYRGVNADITESKKMLEEIVLAKEKAEESDKLKTAFINNISHEIRTPLNGILGFGQFLADSDLAKKKRMKYFGIMQKSSNRLMNTVSDYVDMARIVSGTMEVHTQDFNLHHLFHEIDENFRQLCEEKNIVFETEEPIEPTSLILHSNSEFLRKIMNNLLDNALKFTREGSIHCGYRIIPGFIEFYVQDTGCGIVRDKLEIIFDMFSQEDPSNTRGYEGSGLGLAIAQGLVKLLGGDIKVMSEKGKGSLFTVSVPYHEPTPAQQQVTAKTSGSTDINKPLILIAEDEETNYLYVEVIMQMTDCKYILVNNGAEAVDICRKNDKITMVLMDIKMPVMNGLEATKVIHEIRPELPIIAMTAYAQTDDEYRFMAAGCNGYLAKPIKKDKLISLLQTFT
ncbi:MAG: response regulator, partial [Bacteroidales bacterium]